MGGETGRISPGSQVPGLHPAQNPAAGDAQPPPSCCSHRQQGARLQIPLSAQQVLSCSTQDRREQDLQVRSFIHAGVGDRLPSLGTDCAPAQPHLQLQLGVRPSPGINSWLHSNKGCRISDLAIKIRSLSDTTAQQAALVAQSAS